MSRSLSRRLLFYCFCLILSGCVGKNTYKNNIFSEEISLNQNKKVRVLANIEDWKNSGVKVIAGNTYNISAKGRWFVGGACNWTGPDGIGLYNLLCLEIISPRIKGWSYSALIAKVGINEEPFAVGPELEFTADKDGGLFFIINDAKGWFRDNQGYVDVKVTLLKDKSKLNLTIPSQSTQSSADSTIQITNNIVTNINIQRNALIIGNSNYSYSPLKNPSNDAKDIAITLKNVGFNVSLLLDANQEQMEDAIALFGQKIANGGTGLFYFAGHGVEFNGDNYLIPVNAILNRQKDVRYKAVNLGQILDEMGAARNGLNIVILDACRNNPLPRSFRSARRGLTKVESPKGTIIAYATAPGSVASDGTGRNGIYTKHLITQIQTPGLSVEKVFKNVLRGVESETGNKQIPWMESSYSGDFYFQKEK